MGGFLVRRVLGAIPVLIAVSVIMFTLMKLGPNPLELLSENPSITAQDIARISKLNGWDRPPIEQYVHWAKGFVTGDLGTSTVDQRPATEKIAERLPLTLMLTGLAMMVSLVIAVPAGSYMAIRKYSRTDYVATFLTFAMMASPSFFMALLLQLFAVRLQDALGGMLVFYTGGAPACVGGTSNVFGASFACLGTPLEVFQRLLLPVTALSLLHIAGWSRYMRSELLSVINQDYVRTAHAKGLAGRVVFLRHSIRNAMLPIVTIVALDVAGLFGGAVITETVFGLPGMGSLLLESVKATDIAVVLAIVMIGAVLVLVMTTLAEVLYGILDPRVRVT